MNYIIQPSAKSLANADRDTALAVGHACQIVRNAKVGGMAEKDCLLVINVGTDRKSTRLNSSHTS